MRIRVPAHPHEIEVGGVIADVNVRWVTGRFSVRRGLLSEAAQLAQFGCGAMRLHTLKIIQTRRPAHAWDLYTAGSSCEGRTQNNKEENSIVQKTPGEKHAPVRYA